MEQFKYKARKRDGTVVYGTVNAPNEAAVAAFIRKQEMYVANITASKKKGLLAGALFEESINLYDISIFARQFATLLGAGVPLLTGLEILTYCFREDHYQCSRRQGLICGHGRISQSLSRADD